MGTNKIVSGKSVSIFSSGAVRVYEVINKRPE